MQYAECKNNLFCNVKLKQVWECAAAGSLSDFVAARKQENLYAWVTYLQILTLEYAAGDYLPNGNGKKELNSGVKLE